MMLTFSMDASFVAGSCNQYTGTLMPSGGRPPHRLLLRRRDPRFGPGRDLSITGAASSLLGGGGLAACGPGPVAGVFIRSPAPIFPWPCPTFPNPNPHADRVAARYR